jgi:predicted kinase
MTHAAAAKPGLIIFSGLPGTGKSSLAEAVARHLSAPVFAKDWLEAVLLRCQLQPGVKNPAWSLGYAGYELLTTLAERQLMLGQSVILDSVAGFESIRQQWRDLAVRYSATWRVIECICSDETIHRQRLAVRQRMIPGWHELAWSEVERVGTSYTPWQDECLVLDSIDPLDENIAKALWYIQNSSGTLT